SRPPSPSSALPPAVSNRRSTSIDFAENQLFPGLIGLSPLATSHPLLLQQSWVRSSSACYRTFNLPMARSPGFGSDPSNYGRPFRTRFRCASTYRLKLATKTNSLTHYTKCTPSPDARNREPGGKSPSPPGARYLTPKLRLLVGTRFQELFHPGHPGSSHLSLTVL